MLRLELAHITKAYPSVVANDDIGLRVAPGEIHAVLGENGAGKSTLMKIIYGAVQPDAGTVHWNGQPVTVTSPAQARALGISMVYQHFSLFGSLTVAENVWLGVDTSLSLASVSSRIEDMARQYGLELDPARPLHTLSVGECQRVEIVRALMTDPQLLILDEPTSVLTPQAVERLFDVLRLLAARGCSILYISHKLHEIRALCSACTVLRAGRVTGQCDPRQESNASLSRLMIGAEPPRLQRAERATTETVLQVRDLKLAPDDPFGTALDVGALEVRAGEVLGVAGVSGNGQPELLRSLSGEDRRALPGTIMLSGQDISQWSAGARRDRGLRFIPEERLGRGAVPAMTLTQNLLLTRPRTGRWLRLAELRALTAQIIERFGVKAPGPEAAARSLSGGNLQKFIVGREIAAAPRLLIVSQPTWGVDVGAAARIRAEILALRDAGCAVLLVSEELDELFELSDRLVVMARGRLSPSIARDQASVEQIGMWMSGLWTAADSQTTSVTEKADALAG
jgi:simple sugar transport system ATP-binding protein